MYIGMYILHVVFIFCIYVYTRVCGQIKGAAWGHICHRHKIITNSAIYFKHICMYVCMWVWKQAACTFKVKFMQKDLSVQLVTSKIKCGRRYAHVAGSLPTSRVVSLLIRFMLVNIFRKLINHYTKSLYCYFCTATIYFSVCIAVGPTASMDLGRECGNLLVYKWESNGVYIRWKCRPLDSADWKYHPSKFLGIIDCINKLQKVPITTYPDTMDQSQTIFHQLDIYVYSLSPGCSLDHNCRWLSVQMLFQQCD